MGDDIVEVARFHALHIPLQRVETEQDAIAHAVRLQVFGYDVGARVEDDDVPDVGMRFEKTVEDFGILRTVGRIQVVDP